MMFRHKTFILCSKTSGMFRKRTLEACLCPILRHHQRHICPSPRCSPMHPGCFTCIMVAPHPNQLRQNQTRCTAAKPAPWCPLLPYAASCPLVPFRAAQVRDISPGPPGHGSFDTQRAAHQSSTPLRGRPDPPVPPPTPQQGFGTQSRSQSDGPSPDASRDSSPAKVEGSV